MLPGKPYRPEDLLRVVWRGKWMLAAVFVTVAGLTWLVAQLLPNVYRSQTAILIVPQRVPESYVRSTVTSRIDQRLNSIGQQILSRPRLERIITDYNLYAELRRTVPMEQVIERMRRDIAVEVMTGETFTVSYLSETPENAMRVASRLASLFIEENLRDREVLAEGTSEFLEVQLDDARRRLIEHEKKLETYRQEHSGQLPSQLESNLQAIGNLQMQVLSIVESTGRDRDRRMLLARMLADNTDAASARPAEPPPVPADAPAARELEAARAGLRELELRLKPTHPDIARARKLVDTLEPKAAEEARVLAALPPKRQNPAVDSGNVRRRDMQTEMDTLDRQIAAREAEERSLRQQMASYQARIDAAPARESELVELTRDYETLRTLYTGLLAKREESKISANLERRQIGEQFRVLEPARLPERPYAPNRPRINLIGAVLGLALGLGLVALIEYRDSSLHTGADVTLALSLPVLAMVPYIETPAGRRRLRRRRFIAATTFVGLIVAAVVWRFAA